MNLGEKILEILSEPVHRYKGMSVNILGLPVSGYKKQSFYNSLSKLKKEGYILTSNDRILLSNLGKKHVERRMDSLKQFISSFSKEAPKDLIIMYDIPQERKAEREWFRFHLRKFGYEMIQKSVWVGPSPLPKKFVLYLKRVSLEKNIKILKLAKAYTHGSFGLK